ncbi:vomeronasal type-1 receptor 4-like [Hippopotamus amphibius kiboko]|uniref:vomeronasal type-1 receptor 4-like n=1 Tax=Hippopotamus amphibius kiboko TaxID=575201 RepID=UPI0025977F01|nr:vomeronasal type-1 receptor 4-like [Hippopotamus amphibius kiboko]
MSFHKDALRNQGEVVLTTILLLQMVVGTLANAILFLLNISPIWLGHKQRPTQTILTHMVVANLLILLSPRVPHIMAAFVPRTPLSTLGCKFIYYTQRVARSATLCSTCVLSTYQSFTLIPRRQEWMMLRGRVPKVIGPSCCACWILSFLMHIYVPVTVTGPQDTNNYTDTQGKWFCSTSAPKAGFFYLWSISDAVFIGLMVWSSGSTVLLLCRHHQRMQCIRTPAGQHKCPPETRAAHTILLLVVTFVIFYVLDCILAFYIAAILDLRLWLLHTANILASCFPSFSPLLLILRDPKTPRFCSWGEVVNT